MAFHFQVDKMVFLRWLELPFYYLKLSYGKAPIMFDIALRPLKDQVFDPICTAVPKSISPAQLTFAAFICGVLSCVAVANGSPMLAVSMWILNRCLDCLDGAIARQRGMTSDLGGFLDLLGDFIIYSAIPICCTWSLQLPADYGLLQRRWLAVAVVESTFHVNNFVLFFIAALTEKQKVTAMESKDERSSKRKNELTTLSMKPALVEGAESGLIFTFMLAFPKTTEILCWLLAAGVVMGTSQRVIWTVSVLSNNTR